MHVAVLIVSYRSDTDLPRCLGALERSTHADFRVVICENGGEEAYRRLSATLPNRLSGGQAVKYIHAQNNLGFAGGVNFAFRAAGPADAYWILNPDTEPAPTALDEMVARLGVGDCGAVGHDLVLPSGLLASRGGRWEVWSARAVSIDHGRQREPRPAAADMERRMNYLIGASALVSAGFVERVGLMREEYFLYCEEVEWFLRAISLGERLGYASDALVLHAHGTSTGGGGPLNSRSRISVYLIERNRLHVTRDRFPLIFLPVAVVALLQFLIKYGKAGAWKQLSYGCAGWVAGLLDRRGKPAWFN